MPADARDAALERSSAWVDANLARFRPSAEPRTFFPSLRSIGELAHAAELMGRRGAGGRSRRWLEHGWRQLGEGQVIERLVDEHPGGLLALTLLPAFERAGLRRPGLLALAARRAPRARLAPAEWAYLAPVLAGLGVAAPPDAATAAPSILASAPPPWSLSLEAMYQLTHEVFYATDWAHATSGVPAPAQRYLDSWLPPWLAFYADDSDLLAELILVAHCLPGGCVESEAWSALLGAQRDDGAVRPPDRRVDWGAADPADEEFARHRHPTLVTIMALASCRCTTARQARRAPA